MRKRRMAGEAVVERTALRALYEGAPATAELLARATGRSERVLRAWARREGWGAAMTGEPHETLEARLLVLSDRLVRGLEALSAAGEHAGGDYDKARIDALTAMLRMVEKIGEITRGAERAKENQMATDAEMASLFERIDTRILELAGELALQMVQPADHGPAGAADPR